MSIITNVFSALGNNSSLYPIIFKDSIDNGGRVVMAYKEGGKNGKKYGMYDARERFIEENATSLVWIGGIPALKLLYDRLVTNKIYKFAGIKELGGTFDKQGKRALADTNLNLLAKGSVQSLKENIDSIREAAKSNDVLKKLVEEADKILANPDKFRKTQAGKMAVSTLIPLVTVGFLLPKAIQKLTKKIYSEDKHATEQQQKAASAHVSFTQATPEVFSSFAGKTANKNQVAFGGKLGTSIVNIFNNDVCNQAILDAGISGGRIITGVNLADKVEKAIKEAGIVFFIYLGGRIISDAFEKIGNKLGMPIALDSKILEDKESFLKQVKEVAGLSPEAKEKAIKEMLNFPEYQEASFKSLFKAESSNPEFKNLNIFKKIDFIKKKLATIDTENEKSIMNFINEQVATNVENNEFKNTTLKIAKKVGEVDLIEGVKNPLQYINTKKIIGLNSSLKEFIEKALKNESPEAVEKFLKKALNTKRGSIALNLAICSSATAYFLPKLQYLFREKFTKSSKLPSLATYDEQIESAKTTAKA